MKSRNTAPRHRIDLVLGASYSRINLTSPALPGAPAERMAGIQLPASSPYYKVKSILGSGLRGHRLQPVQCWLPFLGTGVTGTIPVVKLAPGQEQVPSN